MRYGFKQLLLLGAIGLSSLGMSKTAKGQTDERSLPLEKRSYTQKVKDITQDGRITAEEVAELTYDFIKQDKADEKRVAVEISEGQYKRNSTDDNHVYSYKSVDLRLLDKKAQENNLSEVYVGLSGYTDTKDKKDKLVQKNISHFYKLDAVMLNQLVSDMDEKIAKSAIKDNISLLMYIETGSSSAGYSDSDHQGMVYFSVVDLQSQPLKALISAGGHEIGHEKEGSIKIKNRSNEVRKKSELLADEAELVDNNYDIKGFALCYYYSFVDGLSYSYNLRHNERDKAYSRSMNNMPRNLFVQSYAGYLRKDADEHRDPKCTDVHDSDLGRIRTALILFVNTAYNQTTTNTANNPANEIKQLEPEQVKKISKSLFANDQ